MSYQRKSPDIFDIIDNNKFLKERNEYLENKLRVSELDNRRLSEMLDILKDVNNRLDITVFKNIISSNQ